MKVNYQQKKLKKGEKLTAPDIHEFELFLRLGFMKQIFENLDFLGKNKNPPKT